MNILEIMGNLGADPDVRFTPSGQKVTTLRVADNVRRGGVEEEPIWWELTLWGETFDKMMPYLKKGSGIIAVGEMMRPEMYTDKEGKTRIRMKMRVEFLRFPPFGKSERQEQQQGSHMAQAAQAHPANNFGDNNFMSSAGGERGYSSASNTHSDDEMPF